MVCGCVWTKNIKILAARPRVWTTFGTATSRAAGRRKLWNRCGFGPGAERARQGTAPSTRSTTGSETQVCAFLFQLITAVQFFFALSINSMSLMMDCISMEIDTVTYLGNLYAEVKRQSHELSDLDKAKISLVFSGISIGILTGMTTWGLIDVISTLAGGSILCGNKLRASHAVDVTLSP